MQVSPRNRARVFVALAAGLSGGAFDVGLTYGQQNIHDRTVFLTANDSSGAITSFSNGGNWGPSSATYSTPPFTAGSDIPAGQAPTVGYAYVVEGSSTGAGALRTSDTVPGTVTFGGDSLTIIPFNGQPNLYNFNPNITNAFDQTAGLFLQAGPNTVVVNNLVLANGGAIINNTINSTALNGNIYLAPTGTTLDGIFTSVSGGILDSSSNSSSGSVLTINANISGPGLLHIVSSGGTSTTSAVALTGNNTFTGGVTLDDTIPSSNSPSTTVPHLQINSPTAIGTGTFTIKSADNGPVIDNTTGAPVVLTTNNAQQWNGNFAFLGTNSLDMGSGPITLGAPVKIFGFIPQFAHDPPNTGVLKLDGVISGGNFGLNIGTYALVELTNANAINYTGGTIINDAGTLALGVGGPGQFTIAQFNNVMTSATLGSGPISFQGNTSTIGIDTTADPAGITLSNITRNISIAKLGTNTLTLSGNNTYNGDTKVIAGTLKAGSATAFGGTNGSLALIGTNSVADLNGFSVGSKSSLNGTSAASLVTNTGATNAILSIGFVLSGGGAGAPVFNPLRVGGPQGALATGSQMGTFNGRITDGPTATTGLTVLANTSFAYDLALKLTGSNTYSGPTTLTSFGFLNLGSATAASPNSTIFFHGGGLQFTPASGGTDPSSQFAQDANEQYVLNSGGATPTLTGNLNSLGGSLLAVGSGAIILAGSNAYNGPTTVGYVDLTVYPSSISGTLQISSAGSIGHTTGISVTAGSTMLVGDNSGLAGLTGAVVGGAPITVTLGDGSVPSPATLAGVPGVSATWAGNVDLANEPLVISGGVGGTLSLTGVVSDGAALTLSTSSTATTILSGNNTYSGGSTITTGTVQAASNTALGTGAVTLGTATLVLGTITAPIGPVTLTNNINVNPSAIVSIQLKTSAGHSAGSIGQLTIGQSSTVTLISNNVDATNTAGVLTVNGLIQTTASSGLLDLENNALVVHSSALATIYPLVQTGYNTGTQNGSSGILSTTAATNPTHLTTLGVIVNDNGSGTPLYGAGGVIGTTFSGASPVAGDILVKYTYYGDSNLDGRVDGSDYTLIDNGFHNQSTGWYNGDFNYDGVINGSDYTLIDNAFNTQGARFASEIAGPSAVATALIAGTSASASVPEPASVAMLCLTATGLLSRRRRHS